MKKLLALFFVVACVCAHAEQPRWRYAMLTLRGSDVVINYGSSWIPPTTRKLISTDLGAPSNPDYNYADKRKAALRQGEKESNLGPEKKNVDERPAMIDILNQDFRDWELVTIHTYDSRIVYTFRAPTKD